MFRSRAPIDWIFDEEIIKNSPSHKAGMSEEDETVQKRKGIEILKKMGAEFSWKLNNATGVACVLFHRFYTVQTIQEFPCPNLALGCLFLAGKVEDTPKKCKDIAQTALRLFGDAFFLTDPRELKDDIMGMERVLLFSIRFDYNIELPYKYIITYANDLKLKYDPNMVAEIVCSAWPLVNDSFFTSLCLACEPQVIAVSLLWLAIKLRQREDINETRWWDEHVAELSSETMEGICHEVLDYYTLMNSNTPAE